MPEKKPKSIKEIDFKPRGEVFPSPSDWRDQFIYFLLLDRFNDGKERPLYIPTLSPDREDREGDLWQGGNLRGVLEKLDYIKGLGCTCIWLSPIFKNRMEMNTYHGYGIQNFLDIDPRFGNITDLQDLVEEAHRKDMYVILDIILNHTGDNWAYLEGCPGYSKGRQFDLGYWRKAKGGQPGAVEKKDIQWPDDGVWPEEFQEDSFYRRKGEIKNWDEFPEAKEGDFNSLKDLDTSNPEVREALIDVYKYWIAIADVDGYRLDAVKHLEDSNTAIICNAIREYSILIGKRNFFLFGEVVGDDKLINQFIGRNVRLDNGERFPSLDSALDFYLWGALEPVIKGFASANPKALMDRYESFRENYSDHGQAGQYFVTFIDNHDQIGRSPRARFLHQDPVKKQAILAMGYLLTSMGVPCIYYGTEQGFDGGGCCDKYLRECLFGGRWGAFGTTGHHFFNFEHDIYKGISQIAEIRKREPVLKYGRQYFREISENGTDFGYPNNGKCTLAYSRILDDTEILVALNVDSSFRNDYVPVDRNLTPVGKEMMVDLLRPDNKFDVDSINCGDLIDCRHVVRIPLNAHEMAILKRIAK